MLPSSCFQALLELQQDISAYWPAGPRHFRSPCGEGGLGLGGRASRCPDICHRISPKRPCGRNQTGLAACRWVYQIWCGLEVSDD